ncbi:Acyl carrier protein [bioreactor metagenome]|jgi:acyl carrier protein|uniref:Acyl carrier protein n=1 Tax=bioreactor metagenome TaxID=1076179 RepID=A0A644VFD9_9ZZZZ|nr:acyl carrier protein [Lentimicrobium sp.]MEA5112119.1 acyl carrier protein [Lentimicrobium sp.]
METKFLEQFTELLEMEQPVKLNDIFREYENWDSLAYLSVISFVDEEYGIVIPREEFGKMKTVKDIIDYIAANS